jgi:tricorn protease
VSVDGGHPEELPVPHAFKAAYSPDGKHIAYTPLGERFRQWKNYRGGTVSRIWLYDTGDHSVVQIPQPEGRSNDTDPMWVGSKVYFLSYRNGELNLFSYDVSFQAVSQLTHYDDFPILSASAGAGRIIYEQSGYLHLFTPDSGESRRVTVGVAADVIEARPRYEKGARFIRSR